jgi:hypothetical protein
LSGTSLDGSGLNRLAGLKRLEYLGLRETSVSDADVRRLEQSLSRCKIVREW